MDFLIGVSAFTLIVFFLGFLGVLIFTQIIIPMTWNKYTPEEKRHFFWAFRNKLVTQKDKED